MNDSQIALLILMIGLIFFCTGKASDINKWQRENGSLSGMLQYVVLVVCDIALFAAIVRMFAGNISIPGMVLGGVLYHGYHGVMAVRSTYRRRKSEGAEQLAAKETDIQETQGE